MGYADFSREEFFSRLFRALREAPRRERAVEAMRKRRIVHVASLILFLRFRKGLSSEPVPFGRLDPKAARSRRGKLSPFAAWIFGDSSLNYRLDAAQSNWGSSKPSLKSEI
ncbi:MAG: hypothetical protein WA397_02525 [Roseiarcus sp.]